MATTERSNQVMNAMTNSSTSPLYDLVCIGFGATQLATAIANRESRNPLSILFVEKRASFSWASESHLSRTRMDSPFMYDLATLRNPRTAFSYANYLLARGRLIEFANSDRLNPLREEFADYMKWCAEQFKDKVRYGCEVTSVGPVTEAGFVNGWKVDIRDNNGHTHAVQARTILAPSTPRATGSTAPVLPMVNFLDGQRIISMDDYPARRNELRGVKDPRLNISVVGSGEKTTEILDDLLSCPRLGNITVVTENETLAPLTILNDSTPPQPQMSSAWTKASSQQQASVTKAPELIQTLYMRAYEKQVQSKGEFTLRVIIGKDADAACLKSDFIIRDTAAAASPLSNNALFQNIDTLILGCRPKGESLEEVHFKRGAVVEGCRLWLASSRSEGGRALAKDIALMAGDIVHEASLSGAKGLVKDAAGMVQVSARI